MTLAFALAAVLFGSGDDLLRVVAGIILVSNVVPPFAGGGP